MFYINPCSKDVLIPLITLIKKRICDLKKYFDILKSGKHVKSQIKSHFLAIHKITDSYNGWPLGFNEIQ
jgi:hypothetical protein